jgi:hypothetical protein
MAVIDNPRAGLHLFHLRRKAGELTISQQNLPTVDIDLSYGSLSPRSGPLPKPHTSTTAALVYASDLDRSFPV